MPSTLRTGIIERNHLVEEYLHQSIEYCLNNGATRVEQIFHCAASSTTWWHGHPAANEQAGERALRVSCFDGTHELAGFSLVLYLTKRRRRQNRRGARSNPSMHLEHARDFVKVGFT